MTQQTGVSRQCVRCMDAGCGQVLAGGTCTVHTIHYTYSHTQLWKQFCLWVMPDNWLYVENRGIVMSEHGEIETKQLEIEDKQIELPKFYSYTGQYALCRYIYKKCRYFENHFRYATIQASLSWAAGQVCQAACVSWSASAPRTGSSPGQTPGVDNIYLQQLSIIVYCHDAMQHQVAFPEPGSLDCLFPPVPSPCCAVWRALHRLPPRLGGEAADDRLLDGAGWAVGADNEPSRTIMPKSTFKNLLS